MTSPLTLYRRFRIFFGDEDKRNLYTVPKFAAAHKDMLVIIADPHTDRIFVTHKGRFVNGRIRSARGRATHIVRDMMKQSQFKQSLIDQFIGTLVDVLKIDIRKGNQFYSFIDGAVFNLAKAIRQDRKAKKSGKPPTSAGIPSPFVEAGGRPRGDI